MNLTMIIMWR